MGPLLLSIFSLVATATLGPIHAVEYIVTNEAVGTTGGDRFNNEVGADFTKQVMEGASTFIWQTFRQGEGDRKNFDQVVMNVKTMEGNAVAVTLGNKINYSADSIAVSKGDLKDMVTGVLYHEMAHVWQWFGNQQTPSGVIEGIADFVRLKSGYPDPNWVKPGEGKNWDEGYSVTARFLDYCNSLKDGFVADLNGKMRNGYSNDFFMEILGKTVDQLWADYKAKYGS